jgi:2-polyprenyl-3-methyl-5-hydroxy-6-metoxy-1,4-benzoquinol methylase
MKADTEGVPVSCPSCGGRHTRFIGEIPATNRFAGRILDKPLSGGGLYACRECFLSFRHPRRDSLFFDSLYEAAPHDAWSSRAETRNDWSIAAAWLRREVKQGRLLDVGCFDGGFLELLGSSYQRHGIEINENAANAARSKGIHIIGRDFAELESCPGSFDAVTALDVMEHVADPLLFLARLAKATRPKGGIIVSSGNTEALSWRLMGSRYLYCTIAEHISFINPTWCRWAASRLGLHVCRMEKFSHEKAHLRKRAEELIKNMGYRLFPSASAWLRKMHLAGGLDVSADPSLHNHPPVWSSAKDHVLILFR